MNNTLAYSGQKLTKSGKPITNKIGLPVFNSNVDKRIKLMKEILSLGKSKEESKWDQIVSECKLKLS